MGGPLEGIRVIECTMWQQGPVAGVMLGDLGAEVIKIEERVGGDPGRGVMKLSGVMLGTVGDRNFYFECHNRNKRSITLDLRKEKGKEIAYRLIEKADIFLSNFREEALKRLGLDYDSVSRRNARVIYALGSGWGPEGPDKDEPSADYTALARSGLMYLAGEPGMPPMNYVPGLADETGAVMLAYGVLAALLARERRGTGQRVDVSLLGSLVAGTLGTHVGARLITGSELQRNYRNRAGNALWNHYRCQDEKWIALACLQPDRYWADFCDAMGLQALKNDPRFVTLVPRGKNAPELIAVLDQTFATKTREEWGRVFKAKGIPFSRVNTISEVIQDPQVLANKYVVDFDHPAWGRVKVTGYPVGLSQTPLAIQREAPEFGQHTEEILTELLGYSWEDVASLKEAEVI